MTLWYNASDYVSRGAIANLLQLPVHGQELYMRLKYRPEIDGLRALAVVPVILFHAGFGWFSGGYIGVDVFFVISGYLITSIILRDLDSGSFSIVNFYERRARRILPALFCMLSLVTVVAWAFLLPLELKYFSEGLWSVVLFVSNIVFWQQRDYFSPLAGRNPLLHTWSLAVEEQFYIFFPILLAIVWTRFRRWTMATIALGTCASLALAQWASSHATGANFFLLPTRAWELGMGVLCAMHLYRGQRVLLSTKAANTMSLGGIALIIASVFLFGPRTPVPGAYGLFPTIGTALIILFAGPDNLAGRALSSKGIVGIGLTSYSAYLWHQPLLALARQLGWQISPLLAYLLIALTFVLAWLSWAYVERPFREGKRVSRSKVFGLSVIFAGILATLGVVGILTKGGEFRYSREDRAFLEQADYKISMRVFSYGTCFLRTDQSAGDLLRNNCFPAGDGRPRLVLLGDSRAAQLSFGARQILERQGYQIVQWTKASCAPITFSGARESCREYLQVFDNWVLPKLTAEDRIIVGGNWGGIYTDIGKVAFEREFSAGLKRFRTPAKVIVYDGGPSFLIEPIETIFRKAIRGDGKPLFADKIPFLAADRFVSEATTSAGLTYFDASTSICPTGDRCLIYDGKDPIFLDAGHLSTTGSSIVMTRLVDSGLLY